MQNSIGSQYDYDSGLINCVLVACGFPAQEWLSDPDRALYAIALVDTWQWTPMAFLILLAGALASAVAVAVGWALARWVFDFEWNVLWWVPLVGALAGALLAWLAGWWALREVVSRPVMITLRQAAE